MPKFLVEIELNKPDEVRLDKYQRYIQEAITRWGGIISGPNQSFFPTNIKQVKVTSEPDETKLDSNPG